MSRITGNKVSFTPDIPPEIAKQRIADAVGEKHATLDPSPFREETEFGDPREDRAFNERIRYEKQVSDDAGQTWSQPQPCEVTPRFNPSFNQGLVKDGEYIISALVGLRTDELWELIFEKYRLLDPMMMCRRRDEISRLFNMMADSRQISKESIPDSVFKRFLGEESMPRRPIRDNPQA